ncbi:MAG: type II secretion system protein [Phycisphaerales bacterium]
MSRHSRRNNNGGTIVQPGAINRRRTARRSLAFTLIELVVVISLILLLVGLTMSVGLAVRSKSETRQTENVLILLDQAVKQWQIAADRQLSWGTEDLPFSGLVYDINEPDSADVQLTQLLGRISSNQSARDIVAQIDDDFLQKEDGDLELRLVDPWGSPVCLIHPGRLPDPLLGDNPAAADIDDTIRTNQENEFGIALNRALLFVSAGPDGALGNLYLSVLFDDLSDDQKDEVRRAADNVYSYAPSLERPQP